MLDWSNRDSEVKDQSICGSCWAFAAVALVENLSQRDDLSEQVVISCATGSCSGGWYGDGLKYVHDQGVLPESCYVYEATNGECSDRCKDRYYLVQLTNYDYYDRWGVPNSYTVDMLRELLQTGPVCVSR